MVSNNLKEKQLPLAHRINQELEFGSKYAFYLFLVFMCAQFIGSAILPFFAGVYFGAQGHNLTKPEVIESFRVTFLFLGFFGGSIAAGATVFWLARRWAKPLFSDNTSSGFAWVSTSWVGVAYGVGCGLLLAAVFFLVTNLIPIDESVLKKQPFVELLRTPGSSQIVMFILMVTVIPLVEEFLFRGAMFSALVRGKGIVVATIVTTLLFIAVYCCLW